MHLLIFIEYFLQQFKLSLKTDNSIVKDLNGNKTTRNKSIRKYYTGNPFIQCTSKLQQANNTFSINRYKNEYKSLSWNAENINI